jgi:hypothetical protein
MIWKRITMAKARWAVGTVCMLIAIVTVIMVALISREPHSNIFHRPSLSARHIDISDPTQYAKVTNSLRRVLNSNENRSVSIHKVVE